MLFALLFLLIGVVLPFLTAFLAPGDARVIAGSLPTARVIAGSLPTARVIVPTPWPTATTAPSAAPTSTSAPLTPTSAPALLLTRPIPILMYHYVRAVDQASDPLGYALSIAPEAFEQQMAWLYERGYATVRMDTLARCLRREALCPTRPVALTFDDGYEDAYSAVLPVLQRYGFTATFYIVSGFVGQSGYMGWEQLAGLRDAGMEIGAHSVDHLNLTSLDSAEASRQIAQSKADIERGLGINVTSFCYPAGLYDAAIEEQVRAAGFLSATTTRWDSDYSDPLALPRRRVAGGTGVDRFVGIVQGS